MKNQALFSLKDKSEKLKCHLLQFLFGALRVKKGNSYQVHHKYICGAVRTVLSTSVDFTSNVTNLTCY